MSCPLTRPQSFVFLYVGPPIVYATYISDEGIRYKLIVLGDPGDKNPKDWYKENVKAMELVRASKHLCMDF